MSTVPDEEFFSHSPRSPSVLKILAGIVSASLVLILSGHALTTTALVPSTFWLLLLLLVGLLIRLGVAGSEFPKASNWRSFGLAFILVVASLVSSIAYSTGSLAGSLSMPILIIVAYLLTQVVSFDTFVKWFTSCMTFFSIVAMVTNFLFVTLDLPFWGNEITNVNGAVYANGMIVFLLVGWDGAPLERAMGPFWEPGLFASFLIVALIFEVSYRRRPARKWVVVVLALGVLVARSTAGYLLLIPALALFLFKRRTVLIQLLAVVTSMFLLFAFSVLGQILSWLIAVDPELFGKLEPDVLVNSTRYNVFALNLSLFSESPILGYGFTGAHREVLEVMSEWGVVAQTSTSTFYR